MFCLASKKSERSSGSRYLSQVVRTEIRVRRFEKNFTFVTTTRRTLRLLKRAYCEFEVKTERKVQATFRNSEEYTGLARLNESLCDVQNLRKVTRTHKPNARVRRTLERGKS